MAILVTVPISKADSFFKPKSPSAPLKIKTVRDRQKPRQGQEFPRSHPGCSLSTRLSPGRKAAAFGDRIPSVLLNPAPHPMANNPSSAPQGSVAVNFTFTLNTEICKQTLESQSHHIQHVL